ncbi:glycosyl hydrolase [Rariglobus hedericola]|uniref:Cellulase family glycosylhydrolase n=1 Tax=Rariglobus hedericola TaxID=2597822 RepID=A0A556QSG9_9BACT|nr:glycosyl hydrolase [Rariglobus hedericola]TSJ79586.1 cellulase family glycosylhydrolase [Rariglobus hedericola]
MRITAPLRGVLAGFTPLAVLSSLLFITPALNAAPVAMEKFGLCVRPQSVSDPAAYCDQLIASGVKWVRISPEWGSIETSKNTYDSAYLTKLDGIVDRLHDGGVNVLWILCYTAPWASSQPTLAWPHITRRKPANWADWESYVSFITARYNGKISHWEVWNEPDLIGFWEDSVADYYTLLQKAHAKVKLTNPSNTVLLGGLALYDGTADSYGLGTFFDSLMALGAINYFDVTNYHAYGDYARHVKLHQGMLDVINKYGIQNKPIWITETGYTTYGNTSLESAKADRVDQIHTGNLGWSDVSRYFWYCHSNPVITPPNPQEENFGLTSNDLTPFKAFRHYQALDGAQTDFAKQAAYPSQAGTLHTLLYVPTTSGDGSYVTPSGDDRVIAATRYMYYRVNDGWLYDGNSGLDRTAYVDVTFLDTGSGNFTLQYDGTANAYQSVSTVRTNTGLWKTVTFTLNDVKFANRQNNSADFRFSAGSTGLTVRNVTVHKSFNPGSVILQTTPAYKLIDYVIDPNSANEAYNPVAIQGGVECRSITGNNKYFYFRVSDALARTGDTAINVSIRFWDAGTDNLALQYNAISSTHKTISITKTNTNAWRTVTLSITDAQFANAQSYFSDFRITNGLDGTAEYVSRIDVTVLNQAWAVLGTTPDYKRLHYVMTASGEAANVVATIGGLECRSITASNKYLYFRADDDLAGSGNTDVSIAITFWDAGTDKLTLHYNAVGNAYKGVNITKTNTNAWRTVTVNVTDASFTNAQNYSADFRIGNGYDTGPTEYVRRVELTVNN